MLPYFPNFSTIFPSIILLLLIPPPISSGHFNPYSQRHHNLPANHLGGHGPYKEIVHDLRKPNAQGQLGNLVELGRLHDTELHGLAGRLGDAEHKIAKLEYSVKDVEKDLDEIQGVQDVQRFYRDLEDIKHKQSETEYKIEELERNGGGGNVQRQNQQQWQRQENGMGGENLAQISRKLEEIENRNLDLEDDLKRTEGNFRREIESIKMGQENQSTIRSELDRFRDEIEHRMENRISQISSANSPQQRFGAGNGRNEDMDGMINRLARRVEQIETSSGSNRELQNVDQKYSNMQEEQRRLKNQIAQSNQQINSEVSGIKGQLGNLEAKVANQMRNGGQGRNSVGGGGGGGGSQQIDRNAFEAMLRQSQELRRNMDSVKQDMATDLNRKMETQNKEIAELKRAMNSSNHQNQRQAANSSVNPQDFRELLKSFTEIREEVRQSKNEDAAKFNDQLGEIRRLEQQMSQFEQRFGTHEAELSRNNAERQQADNSMYSVNSGLAEMQRAQQSMEQRVGEWERRYSELNGEFNEYKREFKNYQNDNQQHLHGANIATQSHQDNSHQTQQLINNRTRELQDKIGEINRKIVQMDQTIQSIGGRMPASQNAANNSGNREQQQKIGELSRKVETMDRTIKNIEQRQQNTSPNRNGPNAGQNSDLVQKYNELSRKVETIDRTVKNQQQQNLRNTGNNANANQQNVNQNQLSALERKFNELGQRVMPLERTVQTLADHHNQQQIQGQNGNGGQIRAQDFAQLKERFDAFERESNEAFGWKMKNFTEMQQSIRDMQAYEEQLYHKFQEKLEKIQEMEQRMGTFDELARRVEQIQADATNNSRMNNNNQQYGGNGPMDHQQQQQQNTRIGELEGRMERMERQTQNHQNNILGGGNASSNGGMVVQKMDFDDLKREVQTLKNNLGQNANQHLRSAGNLNAGGIGTVQRMEFDDLRRDVQTMKNNMQNHQSQRGGNLNGNNAVGGGGMVPRMEFDDLKRDVQNIRVWKDESERKQRIGGVGTSRAELSPNTVARLEAMNLEQMDADLRTLNRLRPKLEQIDRMQEDVGNLGGNLERRILRMEKWEENKFPEMNAEMQRLDGEMRRQKMEMENMERLKGEIGKLQEIEREALKTLETEFTRFNSIREIIRTVDFVQLDRDIKEFNANKYRLQSVEQEMQKFPDLDLKIRRIEQLEKDLGAMGNLRQIANRMDTLENRMGTLAGMRTNLPLTTGGLGQHSTALSPMQEAEMARIEQMMNRLKLVEENWRKIDGLEAVPLQLRAIEREKKLMEDKLKTLEDFRDDTHRFVLSETRKMSAVEEKMKKLDPLPDKVDTLEANARWQMERVQRADAFVNNFANLGDELRRLKRLDDEWKKFDDVQKFVDKVGQLEILVERQRAKMEIVDWLQGEWQKLGNLEQEMAKMRAMERELQKLGNLDEFVRNVGQMQMDINRLKMQIGEHGNSADMLTRLNAISTELNGLKLASAQLKADFDHRLQTVDSSFQNWNRRLLAVEKLDEEIKSLQNLVEPHRAKLVKLGQHWPQIEALDSMENSVKMLEGAMTERTLRIHKLEQLLNGIDNLGAELQRLRKLENDLRMQGGFEQIQNRLQTLENKGRQIDVQQMAIDELGRGQKSTEQKMRQFGDFEQFVAQTKAAQMELAGIGKKFDEFQAGMRNFDRLAADFRQIQQIEEELKKARNFNGFLNRIVALENSMTEDKKWMETKQNGVDEKIKVLEEDMSKSFYNINKDLRTALAQTKDLEHLPQKMASLEFANLPSRTKTLEDKLDQLNLFRQTMENERHLYGGQRGIGSGNGENLTEISNKLKLVEERIRQMEPIRVKNDELDWSVKELERKMKNADVFAANSANLQENLHKLQTLDGELRKLDELKQIPARLKLLEDDYQALYPLKLQSNNIKNLNEFMTRMTGIEGELATQKTQSQYSIHSLTNAMENERKNGDELRLKIGQLENILGKLKNLDDLQVQLFNINQFHEDAKKYGTLRDISAKIDGLQLQFNTLQSQNNQSQRANAGQNLGEISRKIEEHNFSMQKQATEFENFKKDWQQLYIFRHEMEDALTKFNAANQKLGEMQKQHDALKYNDVHGKLQRIDQMDREVKELQRTSNGGNAGMNPLDPRQIEIQQKLAKLEQLERDVQNLNALRLQMARIQALAGDLSKLDNLDAKLKEIDTLQSHLSRMGNSAQQLQKIQNMERELAELEQKIVGIGGVREKAEGLKQKIDYEIERRLQRLETLEPSVDSEKKKLRELQESLDELKFDFYRQNQGAQRTTAHDPLGGGIRPSQSPSSLFPGQTSGSPHQPDFNRSPLLERGKDLFGGGNFNGGNGIGGHSNDPLGPYNRNGNSHPNSTPGSSTSGNPFENIANNRLGQLGNGIGNVGNGIGNIGSGIGNGLRNLNNPISPGSTSPNHNGNNPFENNGGNVVNGRLGQLGSGLGNIGSGIGNGIGNIGNGIRDLGNRSFGGGNIPAANNLSPQIGNNNGRPSQLDPTTRRRMRK